MKLPFIGGAYRGRSVNLNAQVCRNFFIGVDPKDNFPVSLIGTPGSTLKWTLGGGPIRGSLSTDSYVYHVSGQKLYRNQSLIGTLALGTSRVQMAFNGTVLLLVDGTRGYTWDGATFAAITDPDFPSNPGTLTFQDGYFIVSDTGTNQFYISTNGTDWSPTDFASAEGDADNLVAVVSDRQILWLFGSKTGEVHYNTGNVDFPFQRLDGGLFHYGCAAPHSIARVKSGLVWLSRNSRGQGQVIGMAGGYQPEILSTPQLDFQFASYDVIEDAFAYTYQDEGHEFYCLTFPTANRTWVFDGTSAEWHERASTILTYPSRQRYNTHAFFNGEHLVGDYENGNVYVLDMNIGTEYDGTTIIRDRISQHINSEQQRLFIREVQIACEHGVGASTGISSQTDPQIGLCWSKDGGHTWSNWLFRAIGKIGEYMTRSVWRNLGVSRDWVFWMRTYTDRPIVVTEVIGNVREAQRARR
jgi:hypothetical protein